jgi:hypothetical protein
MTFDGRAIVRRYRPPRFRDHPVLFLYTQVYSVIYDSGSVSRSAILFPRETSPENLPVNQI